MSLFRDGKGMLTMTNGFNGNHAMSYEGSNAVCFPNQRKTTEKLVSGHHTTDFPFIRLIVTM